MRQIILRDPVPKIGRKQKRLVPLAVDKFAHGEILTENLPKVRHTASQIISGKRSVTGDTALRFGHWFDTDPQFWLNLQAQFELVVAGKEIGEGIKLLPTKASLPPQTEQPRLV